MVAKLKPSLSEAIKFAAVHLLIPEIVSGRQGWITGYGRGLWVLDLETHEPHEVHLMAHIRRGELAISVVWHGPVNEFGVQCCTPDVLESYRTAACAIAEYGLRVTVRLA